MTADAEMLYIFFREQVEADHDRVSRIVILVVWTSSGVEQNLTLTCLWLTESGTPLPSSPFSQLNLPHDDIPPKPVELISGFRLLGTPVRASLGIHYTSLWSTSCGHVGLYQHPTCQRARPQTTIMPTSLISMYHVSLSSRSSHSDVLARNEKSKCLFTTYRISLCHTLLTTQLQCAEAPRATDYLTISEPSLS